MPHCPALLPSLFPCLNLYRGHGWSPGAMSLGETWQECSLIVCVSPEPGAVRCQGYENERCAPGLPDRTLGDSRRVCPVHWRQETGQVSLPRRPGAPYVASLHSAPLSQWCHADELSIFHRLNYLQFQFLKQIPLEVQNTATAF